MAYNPYLANNINYMYPQMNQPVQPQQIQNGGLVSVRSEQEARNYPTAPGNSITFKDESQPYVYVKTMGFNQMEMPTFKKYRLVEEEPDLNTMQSVAESQPASWATKEELEELKSQVMILRSAMDIFTEKENSNA